MTFHPSNSRQSLEPTLARAPASPDDALAAELRGFGPLGIVAIAVILLTGNVFVAPMVVVPVGAALVLLWAWRSHTPWREIGYVRPRSWILTIVAGVVAGAALKLMMKAIVMPLLGANPVNQTYHFLAGNRAILPLAVWAMLSAGFAEETVFRGFMFERLGKLFGHAAWTKTAILLITTTWFALSHYSNQGLAGAEQAAFAGLAYGTIFVLTGSIFLPIIVHAAFDLTALAMIYYDVETTVAHLVFK